jgi:hypothetical protein
MSDFEDMRQDLECTLKMCNEVDDAMVYTSVLSIVLLRLDLVRRHGA